jgi:8-oxo-dGTP diphosphatase
MQIRQKSSFYLDAAPILVAVDCIIFGFDRDGLKLLLFRRKIEPFKNEWSVIGSFVKPEEAVDAAAIRVLGEHTGLNNIFMEPLGCYGEVDRDPGARVISQAYFALIRLGEEETHTAENHQARWFKLGSVPPLMLDHNQMVADALEKLRRKARYRPIGFELLPEKFTIPQMQSLYESIYQRELDRRNFRKKILSMDVLDKLDYKDKSTSRKGAFLYRFDQQRYEEMVEKGIDFVL